MKNGKNRFYKKLKVDKKIREVIKYYSKIKAEIMKDKK